MLTDAKEEEIEKSPVNEGIKIKSPPVNNETMEIPQIMLIEDAKMIEHQQTDEVDFNKKIVKSILMTRGP